MVKIIGYMGRKAQGAWLWGLELVLDWRNTWVPLATLGLTYAMASFGTWSTFAALLLLPINLNIIRKRFGVQDAQHFYYAFTLYSCAIAYYVFEGMTHGRMASVTRMEYLICLALSSASIFFILWAKHLANKWARTPPFPPGTGGGGVGGGGGGGKGVPKFTDEMGRIYQNYDYCRKCNKCLIRRDHHCVWLNMCVGRVNKMWFMGGLICGTIWLFLTTLMNLTSICYPIYLFNGLNLNDGSDSANSSSPSRWLLVPTNCPDVYAPGQLMVTIGYITSIYGAGVGLLLTCVIVHQLRLIILGLTYVEYRRGKINPTPVAPPPPSPPPKEPDAQVEVEAEPSPPSGSLDIGPITWTNGSGRSGGGSGRGGGRHSRHGGGGRGGGRRRERRGNQNNENEDNGSDEDEGELSDPPGGKRRRENWSDPMWQEPPPFVPNLFPPPPEEEEAEEEEEEEQGIENDGVDTSPTMTEEERQIMAKAHLALTRALAREARRAEDQLIISRGGEPFIKLAKVHVGMLLRRRQQMIKEAEQRLARKARRQRYKFRMTHLRLHPFYRVIPKKRK